MSCRLAPNTYHIQIDFGDNFVDDCYVLIGYYMGIQEYTARMRGGNSLKSKMPITLPDRTEYTCC
jgi:hypothetical protein